jgi:hypothetical protein
MTNHGNPSNLPVRGTNVAELQWHDPELEHLSQLALVYSRAGIWKDVENSYQALAKIMAGKELGINPVASMNGIFFTKDGSMGLMAQTMLALIVKDPKNSYRPVELNSQRCEIEWLRDVHPLGTTAYTIEQAAAANLLGKSNWKSYPEDMLWARTVSRGARRFYAGIFQGPVYVPEELETRAVPRPGFSEDAIFDAGPYAGPDAEEGVFEEAADGSESAASNEASKEEPEESDDGEWPYPDSPEPTKEQIHRDIYPILAARATREAIETLADANTEAAPAKASMPTLAERLAGAPPLDPSPETAKELIKMLLGRMKTAWPKPVFAAVYTTTQQSYPHALDSKKQFNPVGLSDAERVECWKALSALWEAGPEGVLPDDTAA